MMVIITYPSIFSSFFFRFLSILSSLRLFHYLSYCFCYLSSSSFPHYYYYYHYHPQRCPPPPLCALRRLRRVDGEGVSEWVSEVKWEEKKRKRTRGEEKKKGEMEWKKIKRKDYERRSKERELIFFLFMLSFSLKDL